MKKVTLSYIILCLLIIFIIGCSKKSQNENSLSAVELIFQEIHPENEGRIKPLEISLDKWSWNLDLSTGTLLEVGKHYSVSTDLIPEGLSIEVTITGNRTAEIRFTGNAIEHHVNDSIRGIPFSLLNNVFLGQSEKALYQEQTRYSLGLQFGEGFTVGGTIANANGPIRLREMITGDIITINNNTFEFEKKFEEGDHYLVQIEQHGQAQCCYFDVAEGEVSSNISNLLLTCSNPSWHEADSTMLITETFAGPALGANSSIVAEDLDQSLHFNKYADLVVSWYHEPLDYEYRTPFISTYDSNTNQWTYPQTNETTDLFNLLIRDTGLFDQDIQLEGITIDNYKNINITWDNFATALDMTKDHYYMFRLNQEWMSPADHLDIFLEGQNVLYSQVYNFKDEKIAFWIINDGVSDVIKTTHTTNGLWANPSEIISDVGETVNISYFQAHLDQNGNGAIVWRAVPVDGIADVYLYTITNAQITEDDLRRKISFKHVPSSYPGYISSIAYSANEAGEIVVGWEEYDSVEEKHYIYRAEKRGGSWIIPQTNTDYISQTSYNFGIIKSGINEAGDAFISWMKHDLAENDLFVSRRIPGGWTSGNANNLIFEGSNQDGDEIVNYDISINEAGEILVGILTNDNSPSRTIAYVREFITTWQPFFLFQRIPTV
ncbi:MAG: hypothetical protein KDD46_07695 [Bdellovibrionales bacterium]|nr:hypothetical protein [Bdellovibrionales bacterium]